MKSRTAILPAVESRVNDVPANNELMPLCAANCQLPLALCITQRVDDYCPSTDSAAKRGGCVVPGESTGDLE
jgi:hypothetical protein